MAYGWIVDLVVAVVGLDKDMAERLKDTEGLEEKNRLLFEQSEALGKENAGLEKQVQNLKDLGPGGGASRPSQANLELYQDFR